MQNSKRHTADNGQSNAETLPLVINDGIEPAEVFDATKANSPTINAWFNITKAFIGAASFELPWAIRQSGLWAGVAGLIALCFVANYTIKLLVKCTYETEKYRPTYVQVGSEAFGSVGRFMVYLAVVSMNLGVCSSYVVFISTSISDMLDGQLSPIVCTLLLIPFLGGISLLRTYKLLSFTSTAGCIALLLSMGVTYGYGATERTIKPLREYDAIRIDTFPLFFGNAAFLFLIHSVVIPIEQSMKKPEHYPFIANISMVFVTALNSVFAVICYLWWGDETNGIILLNLKPGVIVTIIKVFLCVDLYFTYALFVIPIAELAEARLLAPHAPSTWGVFWKKNFIRFGLVLVTAALAVLIPAFSLITNLVGGVANNMVAIILPPILYMRLVSRKRKIPWYMILWNSVVVLVGILALIVVVVTTIRAMIDLHFHYDLTGQ